MLTDSGVLYASEDGKHILQGPLFDVSGKSRSTTNQLLSSKMDALKDQMIVYKAPKEKHVITVNTDITCGYCHAAPADERVQRSGHHRALPGVPASGAGFLC